MSGREIGLKAYGVTVHHLEAVLDVLRSWAPLGYEQLLVDVRFVSFRRHKQTWFSMHVNVIVNIDIKCFS